MMLLQKAMYGPLMQSCITIQFLLSYFLYFTALKAHIPSTLETIFKQTRLNTSRYSSWTLSPPKNGRKKTHGHRISSILQVRYFILLPWYLASKNAFLCWWSIMAAKGAQFFSGFCCSSKSFFRKSVGSVHLVRGNTHLCLLFRKNRILT